MKECLCFVLLSIGDQGSQHSLMEKRRGIKWHKKSVSIQDKASIMVTLMYSDERSSIIIWLVVRLEGRSGVPVGHRIG